MGLGSIREKKCGWQYLSWRGFHISHTSYFTVRISKRFLFEGKNKAIFLVIENAPTQSIRDHGTSSSPSRENVVMHIFSCDVVLKLSRFKNYVEYFQMFLEVYYWIF